MPWKQREQTRDPAGQAKGWTTELLRVKEKCYPESSENKVRKENHGAGQLPGVNMCNCLDLKQGGVEK